jgi:hypothetical protein
VTLCVHFFPLFCSFAAALFAIEEYYEETKQPRLPLIISGTITDASGRTLSGQTTEAFFISMAHSKPFCIGLNCALGAKDMRPYLQRLGQIADCFVHAYPNAGLPNAMGGYDESPDSMYDSLRDFATSGLINMAGGQITVARGRSTGSLNLFFHNFHVVFCCFSLLSLSVRLLRHHSSSHRGHHARL